MNITSWNVQWSAALLPPQSMIFTGNTSEDSTPQSSLTASQLFGFFPAPHWGAIASPEQAQQMNAPEDRDATIASPAMVEFVAYV